MTATSLTAFDPGGAEPLERDFTALRLRKLLAGTVQPIKPWLLRQDRIVGIGNLYASEICHDARLAPDRRAVSLTWTETKRLHRAIRSVLRRAIAHGGTTFTDFADAERRPGAFVAHLRVYAREGEPCPNCKEPIRRFVQQGRSTYACTSCQR